MYVLLSTVVCLTLLDLRMRDVMEPEREFDAGLHLAFENVSGNSLHVWRLLTVSLYASKTTDQFKLGSETNT